MAPPRARPPVRCSSTPKTCRRCARPGSRHSPLPMSPDNGVPAAPSPREGLSVPGEGAPVAGARVPLPGEVAPAPGDDLALVAARFGAALRAAGVPADLGRCERFASAVTVARPITVSGLYL